MPNSLQPHGLSTSGFLVPHHLPEFAQVYVHWTTYLKDDHLSINLSCQDLFSWPLFKTSGTSCFAVPPSPNSIPSLTNPLVSLCTVTSYFLIFFLSPYLFHSPLKFLKFSSLSLPFWITWQPPNLFLLPNQSSVTNMSLYFHLVALPGAAPIPKSNKLKTFHRPPSQPFQFLPASQVSQAHSYHLLCAYWCCSSLPNMPSLFLHTQPNSMTPPP